jgi:uncharacterized membrane protein YhhN
VEIIELARNWLALIVVGVAVLLVCEWRFRPGVWISKPVASTGFVGLAITLNAMDSRYGRVVLLALVLGWLGDVLLIPKSRAAFLAGLIAFLTSHLAFSLAFSGLGVSWQELLLASGALLIVGWKIGWPLVGKAPESLRWPARAYLAVISLMVALAAGTTPQHGLPILFGAIAFYLSDLAVARQRFVGPSLINKLVGLPLYYLAQVIFALSIPLIRG